MLGLRLCNEGSVQHYIVCNLVVKDFQSLSGNNVLRSVPGDDESVFHPHQPHHISSLRQEGQSSIEGLVPNSMSSAGATTCKYQLMHRMKPRLDTFWEFTALRSARGEFYWRP